MTLSENSNKEHSQLSSTSDHNKKVQITKGLPSSTDIMFTTGDVETKQIKDFLNKHSFCMYRISRIKKKTALK